MIEHLNESPRDLLNMAGTYLKPRGLLIISTPNAVNLRKRLWVLAGHSNYPPFDQLYDSVGPWRGHTREYTLAESVRLVERSGFSVEQRLGFHAFAGQTLRFRPLRFLYKALTFFAPTLRDSVAVVARKPNDWAPRGPDEAKFRNAVRRSFPGASR